MLSRTWMLFSLALAVGVPAIRPLNVNTPPSAARKTVAILYFDNYTGKPDYDALGRGMSSMMISDLSAVKEIQLVERDRMQELVQEIDRQQTKYFDSTTAVKVGKLLSAEFVVVGAFVLVDPKMRIDTRVVRVATGEILKTAQVTGDQNKFFDLQHALADKLINGLGVVLSPEDQQRLKAQQDANRVDALSTMVKYSQAVALYDRGNYGDASIQMAAAIRASPNSMFMRLMYSDIKRKSTMSATQKAKAKLKTGIGSIFKRPPSNEK